MNWTQLAENRIEEAIASGEFDDLPGKGRPLDLAEYFARPAAERAGAALLKNANVVPPEVQLLKEIARLEEAIAEAKDRPREVVAKLREELQEKRVAFALAMERRRRRDPHAID
jgi:hypothetical protein